jgi:hypothetical protein
MIEPTLRSASASTPSTRRRSEARNTPARVPSASIARTSSSVTAVWGAAEIGMIFSTALTDRRSSQTSGAVMVAIRRITGATRNASGSACSSATRLGTSSPMIRETKVMISTTMP